MCCLGLCSVTSRPLQVSSYISVTLPIQEIRDCQRETMELRAGSILWGAASLAHLGNPILLRVSTGHHGQLSCAWFWLGLWPRSCGTWCLDRIWYSKIEHGIWPLMIQRTGLWRCWWLWSPIPTKNTSGIAPVMTEKLVASHISPHIGTSLSACLHQFQTKMSRKPSCFSELCIVNAATPGYGYFPQHKVLEDSLTSTSQIVLRNFHKAVSQASKPQKTQS